MWIVILLFAKMYQIFATLTLNRVQFVQKHVALAKVIFKILINFFVQDGNGYILLYFMMTISFYS